MRAYRALAVILLAAGAVAAGLVVWRRRSGESDWRRQMAKDVESFISSVDEHAPLTAPKAAEERFGIHVQ